METPVTLSGDYLSRYTDLAPNGQRRTVKSNTSLSVHRTGEITGTDQCGGIGWELTAHFVRGYIVGMYRSLGDGGVGTFFFEPRGPNILNGMWQGWSGDIARLDSGEYVLRRKIPVTVHPASTSLDVQIALRITDTTLGEGYNNASDFGRAGLLVAKTADHEIVGALTYVEGLSGLRAALHQWSADNPKVQRMADLPTPALIKTIAVRPDHAGHGIGATLLRSATEMLHAEGIRNIAMTGWHPLGEENPRVAGIAADNNYRRMFTIPAYWHRDSIEKQYQCPVCGNPCCCAAAIYLHQSL